MGIFKSGAVKTEGQFTAMELFKAGKGNIPVQLESPTIPDFYIESWRETQKGFKLPSDRIVVTTFTPFDGKSAVYMNYFDEIAKAPRSIVVPSDFLLKIMDGEEADKMVEKYQNMIIKNVEAHLTYVGSIGADPEMFVANEKNEIIPAFNFLGSKENPTKFTESYNGNLYWDGFQAEFTTNVHTCMNSMTADLYGSLKHLALNAKKHNKNAKLSISSVFNIPQDLLLNSKPEHVAFGCMPSKNVYGLKGIEGDGKEVNYRTAGGHLHFGLASKERPLAEADVIRMVKALDAILGVACVSLFASIDTPKRRAMYGLAGEYRTPVHGLEYRALSNAWLSHPVAANLVFDLGRSALVFGQKHLLKFWDATEQETIECINECNVTLARKILERNKKLLTQIISGRYHQDARVSFSVDLILNGLESKVADVTNVEKNWDLDKEHFTAANVYRSVNLKGKI